MTSLLIEKLTFAASRYAEIAIVWTSFWGMGRMAFHLRAIEGFPVRLMNPIAVALGLGISVCLLQWLGIAGMLRPWPIGILLVCGLLLAAFAYRRSALSDISVNMRARWRAMSFPEKSAAAMLCLVFSTTVLMPLTPPYAWDELMYHLPHARQWAMSGQLEINSWLRYPWFPYNYDLLYAASLVFGNDILPHLLHATAGWLVAWLIYVVGVEYFDRASAVIAAGIWLWLTRREYDNAYIDMGVTLFIFSGFVSFQHWMRDQNNFWLIVSGFFLGLAVGSKYQALALLPFFAANLVSKDRRWKSLFVATASLAVPCAYWYTRNFLMTGDPFNPIGGRFFGFTDWNLLDYQNQFADLRSQAQLPPLAVWPAVLAAALPRLRQSVYAQRIMALAGWMLAVWVATSSLPRYLMPCFPLLALLSAASCTHITRRFLAIGKLKDFDRHRGQIAGLAVAMVSLFTVVQWVRQERLMAPTAASKEALLTARLSGYGMWRYIEENQIGKIYQIGLENSLYYGPPKVWGDWFGPWRYPDFLNLSPQQLHQRLAAEAFDALVIDTGRFPDVTMKPDFESWFTLIYSDNNIHLYRLQLHGTS